MAEKVRNLTTLDRCGNATALDFVNTVHSRVEADPHEYLQTYADLARWARDGELVSAREFRVLTETAKSRPQQANRAIRRAVKLRELLFKLFLTLSQDGEPAKSDLEAFNKWLASALSRRRIRRVGGRLQWSWEQEADALDRPLWPVVLSAAEILAGDQRRYLKECSPPDGCGWIFLDASKNRTRKWCNMRTCGNNAKARRYYQRHSTRKRGSGK